MQIGNREISSSQPPYLVAECSANHIGYEDYAHKLIHEAKRCGADAIKFQCYTANDMTIDCDKPDFVMRDGPWKGRKLYELYSKAGTPREWFADLFLHAREIGIEIFASVFSPAGVDFLEQFNPPAYKIASMEIVDIPLIKHAATTDKPLIISTGMASEQDIKILQEVVGIDTDDNVIFLHCVSGYPTAIEEANIWRLGPWPEGIYIQGISDHTVGSAVPIAATALGACIIEKHLMLDHPMEQYKPEDFDFSMRPEEFATMARQVRAIWQAMQPSERKSEESSRQARRSLYVVKDMKAGDRFTNENVRSIRPAYGMAPKELERVLQHHAAHAIEAGTALAEEMMVPF